MKQVAVIGAGNFGYNIAINLTKDGVDVLVIDSDKNKIDAIKDKIANTVIADASNKEVLAELGLSDFDMVIIGLGDKIEASIMIILYLKELNVKKIIAKANNEDYGKVMKKVGADEIIYPERDVAIRVAKSIAYGNFLDYLAISDEYSLVEIPIPEKFYKKSIMEVDVRNKYRCNIIAVKNALLGSIEINPLPDYMFQPDDSIVVIGSNKEIDSIKKKIG